MKTNNETTVKASTVVKSKVRIGIVGDIRYENGRKIQETLFKLKNKYKNLEIYTGGRKQGAEKYVKKYALEFGMDYKEYSLEQNLFSITGVYGRKFTSVFYMNKIMAANIDVGIIFQHNNTDYDIKHFIGCLNKINKHFIILK
jgi:hypothetical protein